MWAVLGKSASQKQRELALKEEELRRERAAREAGERAAAPRPVLGEGSKVATITEADYKRRMEQNDAETYRAVESGRLRVLWGK